MSATYRVTVFPNRYLPNIQPLSSELAMSNEQIFGIACLGYSLFGEELVKVVGLTLKAANGEVPIQLLAVVRDCKSIILSDAGTLPLKKGDWSKEIASRGIQLDNTNYTIRTLTPQSYILKFEKWDFFRGLYSLSRWLNQSLTDLCDQLHQGNRPLNLGACLTGKFEFLDEKSSSDESEELEESDKEDSDSDSSLVFSSDSDSDSDSSNSSKSSSQSDSDSDSEESD